MDVLRTMPQRTRRVKIIYHNFHLTTANYGDDRRRRFANEQISVHSTP